MQLNEKTPTSAPQNLLIRLLPSFLGAAGSVPMTSATGILLPIATPIAALLSFAKGTKRPKLSITVFICAIISTLALILSAELHQASLPRVAIISIATIGLVTFVYTKLFTGSTDAQKAVFWFNAAFIVYAIQTVPDPRIITEGLPGLWKFGIGVSVTIIAVSISTRFGSAITIFTLFLMGTLATLLAFRSLGLVCFSAMIIALMEALSGRRSRWIITISSMIGLLLLFLYLPQLLESGLLGEESAERTRGQAERSNFLLLGGRMEPPLSIAAILLRPWLGWGNMQLLDHSVFDLGTKIAERFGLTDQTAYMGSWVSEQGRVTLHSIGLSAWAEGGIFAALLPIIAIFILARGIFTSRGPLTGLVAYIGLQAIWDILFSPWIQGRQTQIALAVVICLFSTQESKFRNKRGKTIPLKEQTHQYIMCEKTPSPRDDVPGNAVPSPDRG